MSDQSLTNLAELMQENERLRTELAEAKKENERIRGEHWRYGHSVGVEIRMLEERAEKAESELAAANERAEKALGEFAVVDLVDRAHREVHHEGSDSCVVCDLLDVIDAAREAHRSTPAAPETDDLPWPPLPPPTRLPAKLGKVTVVEPFTIEDDAPAPDDSPNSVPQELKDFAERGYERVNAAIRQERGNTVLSRGQQDNVSMEASAVPKLLSRAMLRERIRPDLKPKTFDTWLIRAIQERGFPRPLRLGERGMLMWSEPELVAWLEARQRGGGFDGTRNARPPRAAAAR